MALDYQTFHNLKRLWVSETRILSTPEEKLDNQHIQKIISYGDESLQFIFQSMRRRENCNWFYILNQITGYNPLIESSERNHLKLSNAWLRWGKARNYVDSAIIYILYELENSFQSISIIQFLNNNGYVAHDNEWLVQENFQGDIAGRNKDFLIDQMYAISNSDAVYVLVPKNNCISNHNIFLLGHAFSKDVPVFFSRSLSDPYLFHTCAEVIPQDNLHRFFDEVYN